MEIMTASMALASARTMLRSLHIMGTETGTFEAAMKNIDAVIEAYAEERKNREGKNDDGNQNKPRENV